MVVERAVEGGDSRDSSVPLDKAETWELLCTLSLQDEACACLVPPLSCFLARAREWRAPHGRSRCLFGLGGLLQPAPRDHQAAGSPGGLQPARRDSQHRALRLGIACSTHAPACRSRAWRRLQGPSVLGGSRARPFPLYPRERAFKGFLLAAPGGWRLGGQHAAMGRGTKTFLHSTKVRGAPGHRGSGACRLEGDELSTAR